MAGVQVRRQAGRLALLASVTGLAGFAAAPASAQQTSAEDPAAATAIEEIVVTAQRRAENLQEVPVAVSAVGGEQLQDVGATSSTDIVAQIPNLQAYAIFGQTTPLFTLRGVANTEFNSSANTPIPVYSDELLINNVAAQGFALFDVDRVEVLKGPQGTLFGYNASAGVIHFVSNDPTSEPEGGLFLSYGSFNERVASGHVSGPVLGDRVRGRLAFTAKDSDGQFENRARGGAPLGEDERWGVRALLEADLDAVTELTFKLQHGRYLGDPTIRAAEQEFDGLTGLRNGGRYEIDNELDQNENVEATEATVRLVREFGGFDVNVLGGYLKADSDLFLSFTDGLQTGILDLGYGAGPVQTPLFGIEGMRNASEQYTGEIRLSSDTDGPFQYILGAFYMREKLASQTWFFGGDDSGAFGYFGAEPAAFVLLDDFVQKIESYAAFAHTTYEFNDQLTLTVAGRVSRDSRDLLQDFYNFDGVSTYVNPRTTDIYDLRRSDVIDLSGVETVTIAKEWDLWSGRIGLDYEIDDNRLIYASIAKGVKSGAFNTQAFIDVAEINSVEPETLYAYEAGLKAEWLERRLRTNLAVFFYDVDGYHQKIVTPLGQELLQPADSVHFYGGELELRYNPFGRLVIDLAAGWQKGEYQDFLEVTAAGPIQRAGNTVPYTGQWDVNLQASYSWLLPQTGGLIDASVEYAFTGGAFSEPSNQPKNAAIVPDAKTDDVSIFSARAYYNLPGDRVRVGAFARNLFEDDGVIRRSPLAYFGNSGSIYVPRRVFGVTLDLQF